MERHEQNAWWIESISGSQAETLGKSLRDQLTGLARTAVRREMSINDFFDRRGEPRFIKLQEEIGAYVSSGLIEKGYDEGPPDSSGGEHAIPHGPDDSGPDVVRMKPPIVNAEQTYLAAA
jgi:hypothetical protein